MYLPPAPGFQQKLKLELPTVGAVVSNSGPYDKTVYALNHGALFIPPLVPSTLSDSFLPLLATLST